jgi:hypothetical protein
MSIELAAVAAPVKVAASTVLGESAGYEERWAAWQAKGAAHERAFRRKMAYVAPVLILVAAVVLYALLGR